MMERKIKLNPTEANEFVRVASKCDFDVDIAYNRFVIDAKSILGVLALDFNNVLTVKCNGYSAEFDKFLKKFALVS